MNHFINEHVIFVERVAIALEFLAFLLVTVDLYRREILLWLEHILADHANLFAHISLSDKIRNIINSTWFKISTTLLFFFTIIFYFISYIIFVNLYLRTYEYSPWLIVGIPIIPLVMLMYVLQFRLLRYLILRTIDSVVSVILRYFLNLLDRWHLEGVMIKCGAILFFISKALSFIIVGRHNP